MAKSLDLLNIDVDQLFKQHNVAEIDLVHKRVLNEIELKREELRTMVGYVFGRAPWRVRFI